MKKMIVSAACIVCLTIGVVFAQDIKSAEVPAAVKAACMKKFPAATKISWEKENGNYEANWGGKSGEDNAAQFTPAGNFVELEKAIAISELPAAISAYVKAHNLGTIKEAAKISDAAGKITYEAEVKGKDLIFDENGNFVKTNTGD